MSNKCDDDNLNNDVLIKSNDKFSNEIIKNDSIIDNKMNIKLNDVCGTTEQITNDFLNKIITNNNEESEYYCIQAKNNGIIDNYNNNKNDGIILSSIDNNNQNLIVKKKYYNGSQVNI